MVGKGIFRRYRQRRNDVTDRHRKLSGEKDEACGGEVLRRDRFKIVSFVNDSLVVATSAFQLTMAGRQTLLHLTIFRVGKKRNVAGLTHAEVDVYRKSGRRHHHQGGQ